jgi:hypothetical protein
MFGACPHPLIDACVQVETQWRMEWLFVSAQSPQSAIVKWSAEWHDEFRDSCNPVPGQAHW